MTNPQMGVNICGVKFKNPVIAASGTFGFAKEYRDYINVSDIGGVAVKGITLEPRKGNPPSRIAETPSGILNSVGLQNPGVDYFIEKDLPQISNFNIPIIANINGNTVDEYCKLAEKLRGHPIDMIELNISCPNVKQGGLAFGSNPEMVYDITKEVKKCTDKPLIVKLTPNTTDITEIAKSAEEAGADSLSLINTLLGMAIDVRKKRPVLGNILGGLSGPAVMPIALRMVWQVANVVNIPVIGMGGITTGEDAIAFMLAGARAVSVGTANLMTPTACTDIIQQIFDYMAENNVANIEELVGGLIL